MQNMVKVLLCIFVWAGYWSVTVAADDTPSEESAQPAREVQSRRPVTQRARPRTNFNNGNISFSFDDVRIIDSVFADFGVRRTYNSLSKKYVGFLGAGWASNLDTYLEFLPGNQILLREGGGGHAKTFVPKNQMSVEAVVDKLIAKIKRQDSGKTESYWANMKKKALENEFYRRVLFRKFDSSNVKNLKGKRWVRRTQTGEWIAKKGNRFIHVVPDRNIRTFDAQGNLIQIQDSLSKSQLTLRWKKNRLKSMSEKGRKIEFLFTRDGLVHRVLYQKKVAAAYKYKKVRGIPYMVASRDAYGNVVRYRYDMAGRITQIKYHDKTTETVSYNRQKGWVEKYKSWDGVSVRYTFGVNRSNPLVQWVSVRYSDGRPMERFDYVFGKRKDGSVFLASLKETVGGRVKVTKFNSCCSLPTSVKLGGTLSTMKYDDQGRLVEKRDLVGLTTYSYNKGSEQPNLVNQNGKVYQYAYADKCLRSVKGPEGSFDVVCSGKLVTRVVHKKTGAVLVLDYTPRKRPKRVSQQGVGSMTFKYAGGRLVQLVPKPSTPKLSPIMVANKITETFQSFLESVRPMGTHPVMDLGFKVAQTSKPGRRIASP